MILDQLNAISRSKSTKWLRDLTRSNTVMLPFVYFPCLLITLYLIIAHPYSYWWFLTSLGMYFVTGCLGITVTYHRYLVHKSWPAPVWFQRLGSLCGALGGTGSPIGWRGVHIEHHRHSDKEGDPHSPVTRGCRMFFAMYPFKMNRFEMRQMITDPFQRFLHEYYTAILVVWALLLLAISIELFLFMFVVTITIQVSFSNISNYFNHHAHWGAYRDYDTDDESRNSTWLGLLTWGEGLGHNKHHAHPRDPYYGGDRWWEIDPSYQVIRLISKIG